MRIMALVCFVLFVSISSFAQQQKVEKCFVPRNVRAKYQLVVEARPIGEAKTIILDVVVKPKNFTKEYMTKFANRIKTEYCSDDVITLQIFDNEASVRKWYGDFREGVKTADGERRGMYYLNRKTGEETIEYSTKLGNPINEVRIELSAPAPEKTNK